MLALIKNKFIISFAFMINVYLLIVIILCKFSLPDWGSISERWRLFISEPSIVEQRLWLANFTPLLTIRQSFEGSLAAIQWLNLYGNIFIFLPTGILIALWEGKQPISTAVLISFLISLALEGAQLILFMGSFDADDLILNTLGGCIGAALLVIARAAIRWGRARKYDQEIEAMEVLE